MLNLLKSLNRRQKSTIFLLMDLILVTAALILTVFAQPEGTLVLTSADILIIGIPYVTMIGASLLILLNIPNMQLAEFDAMALGRVAAMSLGLASSTMGLTWLFGYPLPLPFNLMFGTLTFILMVIARVVSLQIILAIYRRGEEVCRVLIYGAGTTGTQLVQAFRTHRDIDPVAFVDDNSALQGLTISGLPVLRPVDIADIVKRKNIDRVLLAVPSLSPPKQAQIARRLQKMGLEVQTLPSFSQLIGQEALIDKLRTVDPQMLLNRAEDATPLGPGSEYYAGKTVLVSGAGGSIGSELCRQLIECRPRKLILFELSEYAL
ncbi:MAG: polysaccharide biosynthesis protein, partial [Pseudomonadota bacterium]